MSDECEPYEEISTPELGARAAAEMEYRLEPAGDPDDVIITGPCPRCSGDMKYTWPLTVVRNALLAPQDPDVLHITVICRCEANHPGAGSQRGCGAYWRLDIRRHDE